MDVGIWLRSLGLERYEAAFRDNEIDGTVLPNLTAEDLKDLGVGIVGHRRKLLDSIAALHADVSAKPPPPHADPVTDRSAKDTAERRQVTVMFSDLVGSTALSARLDPEDLREVIANYHKCAAETVRRFGGFVSQYLGDGVLVYFGYPQAHEDDAERAVRAGLELTAAVGRLNARASLQTRVGIATGVVVVGDLVDAGGSQERGIIGETPNLAARLQGLARPNMVVIAESTRKLLGNLFELEELGIKELKGIAGSVRVWAVLRASSVESRFEALHASGLTALVGREEEFELLLRRWSRAKSGEGQVVLLSGEAGIGKSRLTAAMLERLATEQHTRLRYFCSPQHTDSALYPIIGHMERAAGLTRDDTTQVKLDKIATVLAQTSTSIQDAALFAEMLSLPNDGRYPAYELTPQERRQRTMEALIGQLEALARQNPVLMIFEDAHWTDPTSLEVFGRTVDRIRTLRLLLIVTFRPEFEPPWIGQPHVTALTINRLTEREVGAIIDRIVGNKQLPARIRQDIIERTDGIPLFVEEMTKAVLEAESEGAAEHVAAAVPSPVRAVPASLHASLMARLDRLGPAKEVAQIGAAIGREFSHALLAVVAGKPETELQSALNRLIAAGLLFQQGVPPHASYLFKHALIQDAAYGTLLREPRRALHARVADLLESQFPEVAENQPELLARHCTEGGWIEKAVDYRLRSGKQASARGAIAEAEVELRKGLDLLYSLPDGAARQEQELNLQITFGTTLLATRGYAAAEAGEAFEHARQLCQKLNRPQQLNRVLTGQYFVRLLRGELEQAEFLAGELHRLGEAASDASSKYNSLIRDGEVCCWLGKFIEARAYFEAALALWDPGFRDRITSPHDVYVNALIYFSRALFCLGYLDQARLRRDDALAEARRLSSPYTEVYALRHAWYGDWAIEGVRSIEAMLRSAEHISVISSEQGFRMFVGVGDIMRGWCVSSVGDAKTGILLLEEGLKKYAATGTKLVIPFYLTVLAGTYGAAAQPKEGLNRLGDAAKLMETTQERWAEAEMHRVRGSLLLSLGERAAAEKSYCEALAVARHQSAKFWELRAAIDLGRLWRDQGKCIEARELLMPIYEWFTEGFDVPVLRDAKALLAELRKAHS